MRGLRPGAFTARNASPWLLSAPALLVFLAFAVVPLVMIVRLSFLHGDHAGGTSGPTTWDNWRAVLGDEYYLAGLWRSLRLAFWVTTVSLLLGIPEAFVLSRLRPMWRGVCLVVVLGPLLVSIVIRTLGWALLLGNAGVLNDALDAIGLPRVSFLYTETGVVITLVHVFSPFMVLSVWTSLQRIDPDLEWAAAILGASRMTVLRRVVLPQITPGIIAGTVTVFALSASAFATPAIIGGRRLKVSSMLAYDEFLSALDWPLGAALAVLMLIGIGTIVAAISRLGERLRPRGRA